MVACVVECIEEKMSKTNDYAIRSISPNPYGKSFRVIITLLVKCLYSFHLSHPEKNVAEGKSIAAFRCALKFLKFP